MLNDEQPERNNEKTAEAKDGDKELVETIRTGVLHGTHLC